MVSSSVLLVKCTNFPFFVTANSKIPVFTIKAQFRPHTDNGAGAGQSNSLIVGLGNYVGGELVVEGVKKDIRYNAIEFDGWKERHWTLPFLGERYSLVWFTPKGCEGVRGIDMDFGKNPVE